MDISDPKTNMMIIVFIGGLIGNAAYTFLRWWQTKGEFESSGIVIKFDNKFIATAIMSFIPVVIITGAGFTSLLNTVNASNPASYAAGFVTALLGSLVLNYATNKQVPANVVANNEKRMKEIEEAAKLHEFNQKLKEESGDKPA